jgi:hypothetical protein
MVRHGNTFYFHQTIADFRREEIVFPKLILSTKRKIERNPNVFKNWQADTPEILENCARYDFEYWKVPNFIKDPGDIDTIKQVLNQNYEFFRDIFTSIAIKSLAYPCCSSIEFGNIISECNLLDKVFT